MTTRLTGLHHIGLYTADPDRLVTFYRDVFEVDVHALDDPRIRACACFDVGGGLLIEIIPAPQAGPDHLALAVAERRDLTALRDRLLAAGHTVGEIRDLGGACCLDFYDPDGRRGELVWCAADQPSDRS